MADPTSLYSYQGQEPRLLPHEIHYTDQWGATNFRQGVESFTDEELVKAGYTGPYILPEFNNKVERLFWDSNKLKFFVDPISDEELWENIRKERNERLQLSDWTQVLDLPLEKNYLAWQDYRQILRDIPQSFNSPLEVKWPTEPSKLDKDYIDSKYNLTKSFLSEILDYAKVVKDLESERAPIMYGLKLISALVEQIKTFEDKFELPIEDRIESKVNFNPLLDK